MKPPAKNVVRVGGGNVYAGNKDPKRAVDIAVDTHAASWGWSEGFRLPSHIRANDKVHALSAIGFEDMRDANDCIMMYRKPLDIIHFSMSLACRDRQPDKKVDQNRVFSMLSYEAPALGKPLTHIAIHPNWVAGIEDPKHPAAIEYVKSMDVLDTMIQHARSMGTLPVVSGDFNLNPRNEKKFNTSYDIFEDHGMDWKVDGIDGMAWDRRLTLEDWYTIPKSKTGSDHDVWTVGDFKRRGAR